MRAGDLFDAGADLAVDAVQESHAWFRQPLSTVTSAGRVCLRARSPVAPTSTRVLDAMPAALALAICGQCLVVAAEVLVRGGEQVVSVVRGAATASR